MIEAFKERLFISAFTHDMSKFLPSEFIPYANWFYGRPEDSRKLMEIKNQFAAAWLLHQHRNKHHWDYWVKSDGMPVPMPRKYINQMVCDWRAMSRQRGGDIAAYWTSNAHTFRMHPETRRTVKFLILDEGEIDEANRSD
jgi:hypothetical protein